MIFFCNDFLGNEDAILKQVLHVFFCNDLLGNEDAILKQVLHVFLSPAIGKIRQITAVSVQ